MNNDFQIEDVLLLIENKLYIHSIDNILHIELFEESLTLDDNNLMFNTLDIYYDNCQKKNLSFYIVYNFSQLSITSSSNLIYNSSIYNNHFDKHINFFRTNLKSLYIIVQNYTLRESLNTILNLYNPEIKPHIIENINDLSINLSQ